MGRAFTKWLPCGNAEKEIETADSILMEWTSCATDVLKDAIVLRKITQLKLEDMCMGKAFMVNCRLTYTTSHLVRGRTSASQVSAMKSRACAADSIGMSKSVTDAANGKRKPARKRATNSVLGN